MINSIKTFIFDCFGVVCPPVLWSWYGEKSEKYGFVDDNLSDILQQFDLGQLSEDDVLEHFSKYKGITSTKEEIREEIDNYLQLNHDLAGIIMNLRRKGFKTMLLSNGNQGFYERKVFVSYPQFQNLFDEIIISSQIKMVKPDKDIYLHALEKISSKPEESVFIDDNQQNVDAAVSLGMNGFLYTDILSFVDYLKKLGIKP